MKIGQIKRADGNKKQTFDIPSLPCWPLLFFPLSYRMQVDLVGIEGDDPFAVALVRFWKQPEQRPVPIETRMRSPSDIMQQTKEYLKVMIE